MEDNEEPCLVNALRCDLNRNSFFGRLRKRRANMTRPSGPLGGDGRR